MRVMRWLNCFQHIQGMMFQEAALLAFEAVDT